MTSSDQSLERERLEVLDRQVAATQPSLARRVVKVNASLESKGSEDPGRRQRENRECSPSTHQGA